MKNINLLLLRILLSKIPSSVLLKFWKSWFFIKGSQNHRKCFLLCTTGENEEYFDNGLIVTVQSLRLTNPKVPIVIFYSNLSQSQKYQLRDCKLVKIEEKFCNSEYRPDLTDAAFYRLHLDLLEEFDKVLYVDSDMVILDSLDEIFNLPGNLVAAGGIKNLAMDFHNSEKVFKLEGIKKETVPGFNTGFVCFNQNVWGNKLLEEAIAIGENYGWENLKNPVNAILNLLAYRQGGFTSVSSHYNFIAWRDCLKVARNSKGFLAPYVDGKFVKILHFSGPFKPWQYLEKYDKYPRLQKFMDIYIPCYQQFKDSL